jgi:hypothetical protein
MESWLGQPAERSAGEAVEDLAVLLDRALQARPELLVGREARSRERERGEHVLALELQMVGDDVIDGPTGSELPEQRDARACAVLIQAYTLGKIVDDVVEEPVDPQAWNDLIMQVTTNVFAAPEPKRRSATRPESAL